MTPLTELIAKLQADLTALQQQATDNAAHLKALEAEDLEDPSDLEGAALIRAINALDIRKPQHARELEAARAKKTEIQRDIERTTAQLTHRLAHQKQLDEFFLLAKEANKAAAAARDAYQSVAAAADLIAQNYGHRQIFGRHPLDVLAKAQVPDYTLHPATGKVVQITPDGIHSLLQKYRIRDESVPREIDYGATMEELLESYGHLVGVDGYEVYDAEETANA
jgi:hypothetical protein